MVARFGQEVFFDQSLSTFTVDLSPFQISTRQQLLQLLCIPECFSFKFSFVMGLDLCTSESRLSELGRVRSHSRSLALYLQLLLTHDLVETVCLR